jgi:hypothetical protein
MSWGIWGIWGIFFNTHGASLVIQGFQKGLGLQCRRTNPEAEHDRPISFRAV